MRKAKARERKVYDCTTIGELIDYIALKFEIDPQFITVDGADRIYIGTIRRWDLKIKRAKIKNVEGTYDGIVLYQVR